MKQITVCGFSSLLITFPHGKNLVDTNSKDSLNQLNGKIYQLHYTETEGGRKQTEKMSQYKYGRRYCCQALHSRPVLMPSAIQLVLMVGTE